MAHRCFALLVAIAALAVVALAAPAHIVPAASNETPIIGVVTVPISSGGTCVAMTMEERERATSLHASGLRGHSGVERESGGGSCFTSFYVKWLEQSGARVAVVPYDAPESEMKRLVSSTNGLLFTGGEVDLLPDNQYYEAAQVLWRLALEQNKAGTYYPVWGTCQGFQLLNILVANDTSVLQVNKFDSEDLSLQLDFTPTGRDSRLFRDAPKDVLHALEKEPLTSNLHVSGVDPTVFDQTPALSSFFNVISTNVDRKGKPFISTFEAKDYPVYAAQWHPERPQYEWKPGMGINHSATAVRAMQYVSNFFVNEARKNTNSFAEGREYDDLVYQYKPTDMGESYTVYFFPPFPATSEREAMI